MGSGQVNHDQIQALRTIMNTREVYLLTDDGWKNIRVEPGSVVVYDNQINGYEFDFMAVIGSREISLTGFSPVADIPENNYNDHAIVITTIIDGVFTIILTGNGDITIDWGDGTPPETYTLTDVPLTITHDYTGSGGAEHTITIEGEENIITLEADNDSITSITIPPTATELTTLILENNLLTETPVIPDTVPLETMDLDGNPLTICEIKIGTQVWMCKNYDSSYPGSKVWLDDEAYRTIYGGLYSWAQIVSTGFCPEGWHVPTVVEWQSLITFLGGTSLAGGHLKETGTTLWDAPNNGDGSSGFKALGGGLGYSGGYLGEGIIGDYWTSTPVLSLTLALFVQLQNTEITTVITAASKTLSFLSVRLIKNWATLLPFIVDVDGNKYYYTTIGTQQWFVENLKTTKYRDGTPIPTGLSDVNWTAEDGTPGHDGAYSLYNNDIINKADYGALYNWYAVDNAHGLAPTGWRIPSDADIQILIANIGWEGIVGGKLKEIGLVHWDAPNLGATDDYGFKLLAGGQRNGAGIYEEIHEYGNQWVTNEINPITGMYWEARHISTALFYELAFPKNIGIAVRCMRDTP